MYIYRLHGQPELKRLYVIVITDVITFVRLAQFFSINPIGQKLGSTKIKFCFKLGISPIRWTLELVAKAISLWSVRRACGIQQRLQNLQSYRILHLPKLHLRRPISPPQLTPPSTSLPPSRTVNNSPPTPQRRRWRSRRPFFSNYTPDSYTNLGAYYNKPARGSLPSLSSRPSRKKSWILSSR